MLTICYVSHTIDLLRACSLSKEAIWEPFSGLIRLGNAVTGSLSLLSSDAGETVLGQPLATLKALLCFLISNMASTVLITGASQGIGKATALLFAREGYDLILAARERQHLDAVAQEIQQFGRSALVVPTDTRQPEQVEHLVRQAIDRYGVIDILINNAGIYSSGPVEQYSVADWHEVLDTNLWGYIHLIQAVLPHMLSRGQGTIVNLASISGKVPVPYLVPYTTSKFAIAGLTEAMQAELSPKGIQVCGIYPNLIKSDFMERAQFVGTDAQARREQLETVLKAPGIERPEDVAKAIWSAVQHHREEVLVGTAKVSKAAYNLLPGAMQWMFRQTFKEKN